MQLKQNQNPQRNKNILYLCVKKATVKHKHCSTGDHIQLCLPHNDNMAKQLQFP